MNRRKEIDVLRAFAIIVIILSHFCEDGPVRSLLNFGFYLGNFGNALFFSISALLFGLKFCGTGCVPINAKSFVFKRFQTIFVPLWIFLLILIPLSNITGYMEIDAETAVFNFLGCGWFKPIKYAGHLWFITMLLTCYVGFYIASHIKLQKLPGNVWILMGGVIVTIMIVFSKYLNRISLALPLICLYYMLFIFSKADYFIDRVTNMSNRFISVFCLLINIFTAILFLYAPWQDYLGLVIISASLSAISLLSWGIRNSKFLDRFYPYLHGISGLSYYMYLVHLPLEPIIYRNIHNPLLSLLSLFSATIFFAIVLKYLTKRVLSLSKISIR